jgi:beta-glucosidase/6-phospho-beta-glucosidase/beta-galactosidase
VEFLFPSFFLGGFECSTHRRRDGRRLDLIASTGHDRFAPHDYERLRSVGIRAARDGVRWTLVERAPGRYDWSTFVPMARAARAAGVRVVWDLLHFGWPDHVDVFAADFPERFGRYAREFARVLASESDEAPFVAPINEISFLSFAGGERGFFNPFASGRGDAMKAQLVRAAIAACDAIRDVCPRARLVHTDPMINIAADATRPQDRLPAELYRQAMFAAWDMIAGRQRPELGGSAGYLDVIGVNYYVHNQWIHNGRTLAPSNPRHLMVRYMLREIAERYERPIFIAETGIEGPTRANWLRYIGREARGALALGVPLQGVCLYPIVDHPGWEDDRHCPNGLWGYADVKETGRSKRRTRGSWRRSRGSSIGSSPPRIRFARPRP